MNNEILKSYSLLRYCTVLKHRLSKVETLQSYSLLRYCTVLKLSLQ